MSENHFETHYQSSYHWNGKQSEGTININNQLNLPVGTPKDTQRYSPEHLLLATVETCLANYVHLIAAKSNLNIINYQSQTEGFLEQQSDRGYHFSAITIRPEIEVVESEREKTKKVVDKAHHFCIISRSLNCPVDVIPTIKSV